MIYFGFLQKNKYLMHENIYMYIVFNFFFFKLEINMIILPYPFKQKLLLRPAISAAISCHQQK